MLHEISESLSHLPTMKPLLWAQEVAALLKHLDKGAGDGPIASRASSTSQMMDLLATAYPSLHASNAPQHAMRPQPATQKSGRAVGHNDSNNGSNNDSGPSHSIIPTPGGRPPKARGSFNSAMLLKVLGFDSTGGRLSPPSGTDGSQILNSKPSGDLAAAAAPTAVAPGGNADAGLCRLYASNTSAVGTLYATATESTGSGVASGAELPASVHGRWARLRLGALSRASGEGFGLADSGNFAGGKTENKGSHAVAEPAADCCSSGGGGNASSQRNAASMSASEDAALLTAADLPIIAGRSDGLQARLLHELQHLPDALSSEIPPAEGSQQLLSSSFQGSSSSLAMLVGRLSTIAELNSGPLSSMPRSSSLHHLSSVYQLLSARLPEDYVSSETGASGSFAVIGGTESEMESERGTGASTLHRLPKKSRSHSSAAPFSTGHAADEDGDDEGEEAGVLAPPSVGNGDGGETGEGPAFGASSSGVMHKDRGAPPSGNGVMPSRDSLLAATPQPQSQAAILPAARLEQRAAWAQLRHLCSLLQQQDVGDDDEGGAASLSEQQQEAATLLMAAGGPGSSATGSSGEPPLPPPLPPPPPPPLQVGLSD